MGDPQPRADGSDLQQITGAPRRRGHMHGIKALAPLPTHHPSRLDETKQLSSCPGCSARAGGGGWAGWVASRCGTGLAGPPNEFQLFLRRYGIQDRESCINQPRKAYLICALVPAQVLHEMPGSKHRRPVHHDSRLATGWAARWSADLVGQLSTQQQRRCCYPSCRMPRGVWTSRVSTAPS